jgi:hypothetical protein
MELPRKRFSARESGKERGGIPLFTISHAAALHADYKCYIDFIPAEWRGQSQFKTRSMTLAGSAVALYALLGGYIYLFNTETRDLSGHRQDLMPLYSSHGGGLPGNEQLKADREFAVAAERSAAWQQERNRILSELARELAAAVTDEIRITDLVIEESPTGWRVKMDAEIRSSNGSRSQQILLRFQERMRQQSKLKQLDWQSVHLDDSAPPSSAETPPDAAGTRSLMTFSLLGVIRHPPLQNSEGST